MTLDPKALEAVAEALSQYDRPAGAAFELGDLSYGEKQHYLERAEAAINAHLDAADLVERKELEQCHAKATCCCGDYIKNHTIDAGHSPVSMYDYALDGAITERDEARREAEELGKQIAALEAVVKAAREVIEANGREVVGRDGRVKLTMINIKAEHKLVNALAALGDGDD